MTIGGANRRIWSLRLWTHVALELTPAAAAVEQSGRWVGKRLTIVVVMNPRDLTIAKGAYPIGDDVLGPYHALVTLSVLGHGFFAGLAIPLRFFLSHICF